MADRFSSLRGSEEFIDVLEKSNIVRTQERVEQGFRKKVEKGAWRMPRLSEAKKDVISCEKLRGLANTN